MARGTWGGNSGESLFRCNIKFRIGTQGCQTGFHLRDIGLNTFDPQEVADHVAVWANTSFKTILTTADILEGVDVLQLTTTEGGSVSFANTTGTVNGTDDSTSPAFMMAPISMKGELRRRYGQGRMFWPVRADAWFSRESLNAAGITALQGVLTALTDRYLGSALTHNLRLVNVHGVIAAKAATPTTPARAEVPPSWYDVTSVRLSTAISALKSRKA